MTHKEIIKELKAKKYQPVYFLHGTESYYIDMITKYIEDNVLTEGEKSFNQTILYGKDTDAKTLIDTASRYPMMASHQVVILKEAQDMKALKDLEPYLRKPVPTTILVICHKYKKLDSRTKFGKAIKANASVFESKKLYDNQIPDWITDYLKTKKLDIEAKAAQMVAEYLGTDLSKIANELDKLVINLPQGTMVNDQHIQENIGISKDYNIFELQNALSTRDAIKANRIVNYFIANPKKNPLVVVLGTLYNFYSKVYMSYFLRNLSDSELAKTLGFNARNDYAAAYIIKNYKTAVRQYPFTKTQEVISLLKEYDLKSKGVNRDSTSDGALLKELIYNILY